MIVYLLLNTVNNKGYIGQHRGDKISTRWPKELIKGGANLHLRRAVEKYGWWSFSREILCYCSSKAEMTNVEKAWIITLRTYDPEYGYNMTFGGDGGIPTIEVRQRLSALYRGKPNFSTRVPKKTRGKSWVDIYGEDAVEKRLRDRAMRAARNRSFNLKEDLLPGYPFLGEFVSSFFDPEMIQKIRKKSSWFLIRAASMALKGKTYGEILGEDRARQLIENQRKFRKGMLVGIKHIKPDSKKGKTYVEFFGRERALSIREKQSLAAKERERNDTDSVAQLS